MASVVAYLGDGIDKREFVPTAELVEALRVEPTLFGRQMRDLGCQSERDYATTGRRHGTAGARLPHDCDSSRHRAPNGTEVPTSGPVIDDGR